MDIYPALSEDATLTLTLLDSCVLFPPKVARLCRCFFASEIPTHIRTLAQKDVEFPYEMAGLNKANVAWSSLLLKVRDVIRDEWQPNKLSSEAQYRDSLAAFLREAGGRDAHVETEYRHVGTTTDIYLKWDGILSSDTVFIELKYNLRQKTEYDRLIGQIEQINPKKRNLIVVLCGDHHDENLIGRLRDRYKVADIPYPGSPRIVVKNLAKKVT